MKNLFKDRKTLYLVLGLVMISVFTLTVVYAALNTVLTIQGNARVSAADWDIYLNNSRVTNGSATTDVPEIKTSSTLEFSTTLNMPGDFYEFTVDVVNGGDIDAMIENVVKNPELTAEQAKYLKYEITYQNGESITTKQLLAKDTTMPIKVRIEYRKDLNNSDLPTGQVVLDLSLTLEYVQSDGTGSSVNNNGVYVNPVTVVSGDGTQTGDEVCIGEECFNVIKTEDDNVLLFAKNNITITDNPIQTSDWSHYLHFSEVEYWADDVNEYPSYIYNSESAVYEFVENYKRDLSNTGVDVIEARLITLQEILDLGCEFEYENFYGNCDNANEWVDSTNYWTGTALEDYVYVVESNFWFSHTNPQNIDTCFGIRPVIVISKDYF